MIAEHWESLQPVLGIVIPLLVAFFLVGMAVGRFFLDQTVRNLDSALKLADRQLADYRAKLDGASPDEVRHKLDRLEKSVARLTPMELTDHQVFAARKALMGYAPAGVVFAAGAAGTDFTRLSSQLRAVFRSENWAVHDAILFEADHPAQSGVALYMNAHPKFVVQSMAVKAVLEAAGIEFSIYKFPDTEPDNLPQICFTHRSRA